MRWDLIERFEVLKKGRFSRARKSFSGREDFFAEHFPGSPRVPEPFFIEMIAQAGGVLFGLGIDFKKEVILAKVEAAEFFAAVSPPCELAVEATLSEGREDGAWIQGVVKQDDRTVAKARVLLVAMDSLVEGRSGKIVFSEKFLAEYRIDEVVKMSESV